MVSRVGGLDFSGAMHFLDEAVVVFCFLVVGDAN